MDGQEQRKKLGAEADECYVFSALPADRKKLKAPDLVIEVVYRAGGLDKLAVWNGLGAKEVWFWHRQTLAVFVRRGAELVPATRSMLVPHLDLKLIERCMNEPDQPSAVRALRAALA